MTKLLRKIYTAKCITPISIHGIGDCLVGQTYVLDEDQAKYNGGAFDLKNAKTEQKIVKMDELGNDDDAPMTKEQLVQKEMEDNNKVALAKEREAAAAMDMTLEEYREHVKEKRKPMKDVVKSREDYAKDLEKLVKADLQAGCTERGIAFTEEDTRAILITKILDKELKVLPAVIPDSRPAATGSVFANK